MKKYEVDDTLDISVRGCVVFKAGKLRELSGANMHYGGDHYYTHLHRVGHLLRLVSEGSDLWFSFDAVEYLEVYE
jgi:hypothetical protein